MDSFCRDSHYIATLCHSYMLYAHSDSDSTETQIAHTLATWLAKSFRI